MREFVSESRITESIQTDPKRTFEPGHIQPVLCPEEEENRTKSAQEQPVRGIDQVPGTMSKPLEMCSGVSMKTHRIARRLVSGCKFRYLFHWIVNLDYQLYVIRIEIKIESIRGISTT